MKRLSIILLFIVAISTIKAEEWTLDSCISYAQKQNYDVMRARISLLNAKLSERSARVSMTPSINAGVSENFAFGLAEGANNVKESRTQSSTGFNASISMPLFTGLRITNQIKRSAIDVQSAIADIESIKDNVELNVISYYLQALYQKEMIKISQTQYDMAKDLVEKTRKLVDEGVKSESELYEAIAQEAQYSQQVVQNQSNYKLALLDLCQLINYTDVENFSIAMLDVDAVKDDKLLPSPETIFVNSKDRRPNIISNRKKIESAEIAVKEAKADYYPQLSLNASWGTGYYHVFNGENPAFGNQFVNNGSEVVGFSLSIPIYNRLQVRHNVQSRKYALEEQKIVASEAENQLFKDIQTAYYNALAAREKYKASTANFESSAKAFEFAQSKYDNGKSTLYEYNEAKFRMQQAEMEILQSQYEYLLREKILMFYAQ